MLRRFVAVLAGLLAVGVLVAPVASAEEEGCPNEAIRRAEESAHPESFATRLPDCRAYEQVTPVDKDGTNPSGFVNGVQASPEGSRIVFPVPANMPGAGSGEYPPFFLASRGGEGWSDAGMQAPRQPRELGAVLGWSPDLAEAVVQVGEQTALNGQIGEDEKVYLHDSATGSFQFAFSATLNPDVYVAGFSSDDSRVIFETKTQLLPNAAVGHDNLYEFHDGVVSLVGVLPDGSTPQGGSFAGSYNWGEDQTRETSNGGAEAGYLTEDTISSDGSRVFFTAGGTEQIYVREDGASTVPVGAGAFMAATPDGSKVFYLAGGAGGDLTEFDVESGQTTDLTPGGSVQGVLGVSDDGSYVYFAANGVLANGASPGACEGDQESPAGEPVFCSLYVWHDGVVSFIAKLDAERVSSSRVEPGDTYNWAPSSSSSGGGIVKASRVTPDGRVLLFSSSQPLTGYSHPGLRELYRYEAVHGLMSCVSCDPTGASAVGSAHLQSIADIASTTEPSILLRNLSADGSRVFFESSDALVAQDTNGVQDVYEWEQQGVGSCQASSETFSPASGGCLYLISSGTSPQASFFADASASGEDVFFFTGQPLVGQDQDGLVDIYDARVGGGFAAQSPPAPAATCAGEGCRNAAGAAPVFGVPVSASFSGAGNPGPPVSVPSATPKPASKHKAAKPKRKKRRRARKVRSGGRGARARKPSSRGGK